MAFRSQLGIGLVLLLAASMCATGAQATARNLLQDATDCDGCPDELIVFGDSLSDTGLPYGVWSYLTDVPEYYRVPLSRLGYSNGRWTNGKTWVEYLARRMKVPFASFAVGGSQVTPSEDRLQVKDQLPTARKYWADKEAEGKLIKNNLCVILIGTNDFLELDPNTASNPVAALAFLSSIGRGIKEFASELLSSGNCSNLAISDIPPLQLSPRLVGQSPQLVGQLKFAVDFVNGQIKKIVDDLTLLEANSTTPRKILFLTLNAFVTLIVESPDYAKKWGQVNVAEPCLLTNSSQATSDPYAQLISTCKKPVSHLFWDTIHPTTGGHHTLCDGLFVPALIEAGLHVKGRKPSG